MMRVAIIGAGVSGLGCAGVLRSAGHHVTLFDKARGPGGRMSTRRATTAVGETAFDFGATHFTARSPQFRAQVARWHDKGSVAPWPIAGADAWVGTPSMNAPVKTLAADHIIHWSCRIDALAHDADCWRLIRDDEKFGPFDAVVTAMPAEQAATILSLHDFQMAREAMAVRSHAIWSAMFVFDRPLDAVDDLIRGKGSIAFAVRNSAKPGRAPGEAWVVQANWQWSKAHLDLDPDHISKLLLDAFREASGQKMSRPVFASAHRWLLAQPSGRDAKLLWNNQIKLGACGDWVSHGFVEHAWLSGVRLGEAMIA